jgi:uncharacterized protein involved in response to NO
LSFGFRPFFLAASLWAAFALAAWILMLTQGLALPSRFDPLTWHIHEMLFGFVMAAIGGFLLTAVPNWTGRAPVQGMPLAGLATLWLLGRIACLTSQLWPFWLSVSLDLAFPLVLGAVSACELVAGGKFRNLLALLPLAVLAIANLLMHLAAAGYGIPAGLGWRLGLAATLVLVSVIGGRIIPTFTRNWLAKRQAPSLPAPHKAVTRLALGTLHASLMMWAFLPATAWVGGSLLLSAFFNALRLWEWKGLSTREEPLLLILHVGYAWLVAGTLLLGLTTLGMSVPLSAAIHALTVGTIGTMILAVMTRATRGHTGRALSADRMTVAIYGLISAAALLRIAASVLDNMALLLLIGSAAFWIAAFLVFAAAYGKALLAPRLPD